MSDLVGNQNVGFLTRLNCFTAREKIVGWYHTGPKLNQNDVAINELMRRYCPNSVSDHFYYAPNFEKVGSILLSACPFVCSFVRLCVCPYKLMGTPVAIKFGQLDTQVVSVQTDGYSGGYKIWTIRHTSSHL